MVLKIYWEEQREDCVEIDDDGDIPATSMTNGGVVKARAIVPFTLEEMEEDIARYERA